MSAYLDHAATTPLRPEAFEAMRPHLTESFGNPSGSHAAARGAKRAVEDARDAIADISGCSPADVIFTGGGTEADNLALFGHPGRLVCSAIEHHAVLRPVEQAGGVVVPVGRTGVIDPAEVAACVDDETSVVSIMAVNNEIGAVQPISDIAAVVRSVHPDVLVHTDAVQAAPWLDLAVICRDADLVSISGHKFGGPQGVGVLIARRPGSVHPMIVGGGQEQERRSGTHNVAGVVGMAAALEACARARGAEAARVNDLRVQLLAAVVAGVGEVTDTVGDAPHVPGILHLCIPRVESESLLFLLDEAGIDAAAGSSCASGALEPSHVLTAMGVPPELARGALRLSLGWTTTSTDVDLAAKAIIASATRLRDG